MPSGSASESSSLSGKPTPLAHGCGACRSRRVIHVCDLPVYIRGGNVQDTIWRCADCGSYTRAADYNEIARLGHFDVASYTSAASEERLYHGRKDFFQYIIRLCEQSLGRPITGARVLDVGCAYGHLLDILHNQGASAVGVEIVDRLRVQAVGSGHSVYQTLDEARADTPFDAVILLDTLYYLQDPEEALRTISTLLRPEGRLILRVVNRAPLWDLLRRIRVHPPDRLVGDLKHYFSSRGLQRLLHNSGFSIERLVLWEEGKRHPTTSARLYYLLSFILSVMVRRPLTPGLIVVAKPKPAP